jgi:hypothetical protein
LHGVGYAHAYRDFSTAVWFVAGGYTAFYPCID